MKAGISWRRHLSWYRAAFIKRQRRNASGVLRRKHGEMLAGDLYARALRRQAAQRRIIRSLSKYYINWQEIFPEGLVAP